MLPSTYPFFFNSTDEKRKAVSENKGKDWHINVLNKLRNKKALGLAMKSLTVPMSAKDSGILTDSIVLLQKNKIK